PDPGAGRRPDCGPRYPCRADGDKRNLPGDRALPANRAGGRGMSSGANEERATPERGPGPAASMRGPARFMSGMSTEKALDFKGSGRRLLGLLRPYRLLTILALTLPGGRVTLSGLAP